MKVGAVILSALIVAGFYFFDWSEKLEQLDDYAQRMGEQGARISGWPAQMKRLPDRERALAALESRVAQAEAARGLKKDPPMGTMREHLLVEWQPLTQRPGLTVTVLSLNPMSAIPAVYVELKAEGPKDEVYRLLDGLARSRRPIKFEGFTMTCTDNRATLQAGLRAYSR